MAKVISFVEPGRPIIGLSCCSREINGANFHAVANVYVKTLMIWAHCDVVLVPALDATQGSERGGRARTILSRLDGIVLTGSRSMVHPERYGKSRLRPEIQYDPNRDSTTFELISESVQQDVPLLGICRGLQEICCAFGGTLHDNLGDVGGLLNHAAPVVESISDKYLPAHQVDCVPQGRFARMARQAGMSPSFAVNSLHQQGIASVTKHLSVEAVAADGLIEAVSVAGTKSFMFGVQWHPEWYVDAHPFNQVLFQAFGDACRDRLKTRGFKRPAD